MSQRFPTADQDHGGTSPPLTIRLIATAHTAGLSIGRAIDVANMRLISARVGRRKEVSSPARLPMRRMLSHSCGLGDGVNALGPADGALPCCRRGEFSG